jgi:hypothetical protein
MERKRMIVRFLNWLLLLCGHCKDQVPAAPVMDPSQWVAPERPKGVLRVPGKEVTLAGQVFIIAPLNAAAVKQFRDEIKSVFVGSLPDIELVAKMALASLQRNYPGITLADVEQLIDYDNFFPVWEALLNMSGLVAQAKEMQRRVQAEMMGPDSTA